MRIYLDNAATSWPKPESVYQAVDRYQREQGAAAGRSSYREAVAAAQLVLTARRRVAQVLNVDNCDRILWTCNGTDALNLALHGLLDPGDHVVTSTAEHNSVLRPLHWLHETQRIDVDYVECDPDGHVPPARIAAALRPSTRLVSLIHASNVTGAVNPVDAVATLCRERNVLLLVDAAQTLGHWPLDVSRDGPDLVAAPGHKGLLGPLGTGLLYVGPRAESRLRPVRQGGTGTHSEHEWMPDVLPDRFEAGNLNVLGLAGLAAGVQYVLEQGVSTIQRQHQERTEQLQVGLARIAGVQVLGPRDVRRQVGVVSFTVSGYDPQELAATLDAAFGIQVRAGLHCAPRLHRSLGTLAAGGTVRMSVGHGTTAEQIEAAVDAVRELARSV